MADPKDDKSHNQELQSAMHFTSLEISFANPDISIISTCTDVVWMSSGVIKYAQLPVLVGLQA